MNSFRPHPKIVAMRRALASRSPAPMDKLLDQVAEARKYRKGGGASIDARPKTRATGTPKSEP
jgi:hypothetical protein